MQINNQLKKSDVTSSRRTNLNIAISGKNLKSLEYLLPLKAQKTTKQNFHEKNSDYVLKNWPFIFKAIEIVQQMTMPIDKQ